MGKISLSKDTKPPNHFFEWITLAILSVLGVVLIIYARKGSAQFNDAGFAFGVLGFYITIFGFCVTIIAARKAISIALSLKEKIIFIDNVADIASALGIIGELRRTQNASLWLQIPDRYTALRHLLVTIKETNKTLTSAQLKSIDNAIKTTTEIEMKIQTALRGGITPVLSPDYHEKADAFLAQQADKLNILNIQTTREATKHGQ